MVLEKLIPLPRRLASGEGGYSGSMPVSLGSTLSNGGLIDIRKGGDVFELTEGIALGFYAKEGETIFCVMLFYDKDSQKAKGSTSFSGAIDSLDAAIAGATPKILAWVAGRPLGIVDVKVLPSNALSTIRLEPNSLSADIEIESSRLFFSRPGDIDIVVEKKGYKSSQLRLRGEMPGSYKSVQVDLLPEPGAEPAQASFADASKSLLWPDESAFRKKEKSFYSALGRFVLGVPFSAVALGTFFSYSESYSRGAASSGALYASGGAAALCLGLSVGFIIDTAIKLVDVLRASR
jgi:hypothetical protein